MTKVKSLIDKLDMKGKSIFKQGNYYEVLMKDEKGYYIQVTDKLKAWVSKENFKGEKR